MMMQRRTNMIMHACGRCGGAAFLEDPQEDDWRCLQCGRTVPTSDVVEAKKPQQVVVAA
jgi:ribosomal protein S27AE